MSLTQAHATSHTLSQAAVAVSPVPVLLRVQGLKKCFGGQVVLDGVDLELHQGEVVLLRGDNGSGKTTLLNILTGNLEPDAGTIAYLADDTPRTYRFPRHWWQELNPFDHFTPEFVAREGVGRTWQDVRLFDTQTLRDNIAVAIPSHRGENPVFALFTPTAVWNSEAHIQAEARALLQRLGLAGREDSSADRISLGQSKRVAIARAVAAGARILFLDEPLAGLDHQGIADVLTLLETLTRNHVVTLVIVEHVFNQPHLQGLVTTDWLLREGKIQQVNAMDSPIHGEFSATGARPAWFSLLAGDAVEIIDEPLPLGALLTRIRRPGIFETPPRPVLDIRDLIVKRGHRTVIGVEDGGRPTGLNLTVYAGEIAVLQAPNGWGKTTLFTAITGLIPSSQGIVNLEGESLQGLPPWERIRKGLRALPSDRYTFPGLRVGEALQLAGTVSASADLGPLLSRPCSSLSGGEQRRLALAGFGGGKIGLCDEPFGALDQERAKDSAITLTRSQKTLLIAEPYRSNHNDSA